MAVAYYKSISLDELKKIVSESISVSEVMRKLGYTANRGNSYHGLVDYMRCNEIDTTHFLGKAHATSHPMKYRLEEILVKNSRYTNMTRLKARVLSLGVLGNVCSVCGISSWREKPLNLQIDHINGDNRDNRIENLRLICPNCHSQTTTFCRKKK